jgi:hypothetical protein
MLRRLLPSGQGRWVLLSAVVLGLLSAPMAIAGDGDVMKVGDGNSASVAETRIIGQNVSTYATRQSNNKEGDGGSATYGCRSSIANEPCLYVLALRDAHAFDFRTRGTEGGRILAFGNGGGDNARPFSTNATGVATGLNADRVDSKNATDIVEDARALTRVAVVAADGTLDPTRSRGVLSVAKSPNGVYDVRFASDVSKCGYSALINSVEDTDQGLIGAASTTTDIVRVRTRKLSGTPLDVTGSDLPFHLTVTC